MSKKASQRSSDEVQPQKRGKALRETGDSCPLEGSSAYYNNSEEGSQYPEYTPDELEERGSYDVYWDTVTNDTDAEIFARVLAVRQQRNKQYNNTRVTAHAALAQFVQTAVEFHCGIKLPKKLGPKFGALIMVLLKVQRALNPTHLADTYEDMINYSAIADECARAEEGNQPNV